MPAIPMATEPRSTTGTDETKQFYKELFTTDAYWSSPHPNLDESCRWAKISGFLSLVMNRVPHDGPIRILDVGCGRGWLVKLASAYGDCEGIDPVEASIEQGERLFPGLRFHSGTLSKLLREPHFSAYEILLCSEVIEHIPYAEKDRFVSEMAKCLTPRGHVILTTPRGELYRRFKRIGSANQPVEDWLTERSLQALFLRNNFSAAGNDRVYIDVPALSILHRLCASRKLAVLLARLRMSSVLAALRYAGSTYQAWCFQRTD